MTWQSGNGRSRHWRSTGRRRQSGKGREWRLMLRNDGPGKPPLGHRQAVGIRKDLQRHALQGAKTAAQARMRRLRAGAAVRFGYILNRRAGPAEWHIQRQNRACITRPRHHGQDVSRCTRRRSGERQHQMGKHGVGAEPCYPHPQQTDRVESSGRLEHTGEHGRIGYVPGCHNDRKKPVSRPPGRFSGLFRHKVAQQDLTCTTFCPHLSRPLHKTQVQSLRQPSGIES